MLTERQSTPLPLQLAGAKGHVQLLPGGPPASSEPAWYSRGLNCQTVTGTELVRWYAPPSTRTDAVGRAPVVQLPKSPPLRSAIHGK